MQKNLLALTFLFSCTTITASEDQDYQLIKNIKLNDVHTIKDLDTYVQEKPENKDLAFLAFVITSPQIKTKIFEYLFDIKTKISPSIVQYSSLTNVHGTQLQYDPLANIPDYKGTKTEYFLDEEKTIRKI